MNKISAVMVKHFDASVKKLEAIFFNDGKFYNIPRYQRSYAWKSSQVETFWNDLCENESGMFLGTILLNASDETNNDLRVEIIDGQQRILTITILLSVLRDKYFELESGEKASNIHNKFITRTDWSGEKRDPIVQAGKKLSQYFVSKIQTFDLATPMSQIDTTTEEEKRVQNTRKIFDNEIRKLFVHCISLEDKEKVLDNLVRKTLSLSFVVINVEREEDAYTVFESVNAKGADLTLADILKNMIFRELKNKPGEEDIAQKQWDIINQNLEGTGFKLSKFIRYHWLSKYGFLPESKLYEAIRKKLQVKEITIQSLLDDLVVDAERIKKLKSGSIDDYSQFNSPRRVHNSILGISSMNVSQVYVLLLSILRNKAMKKKWERDIEFLEKFCFNYHAISKLQAVRVEKIYSEYAVKIQSLHEILDIKNRSVELESQLRILKGKLTNLAEEFIQFEGFEKGFLREIKYSTSPTKKSLLKYTLYRIEDYLTTGTGELKIDQSMVNLEHILPQNPEQWGLDKSSVSEYVNMVGNLTLLSKKLNSKIGNKPLREKISSLEESELSMTKKLVEELKDLGLNWNEETITTRSKWMAETSFEDIWSM